MQLDVWAIWQNYVWKNQGEAFKLKNNTPAAEHGGGSVPLWIYLAASRADALHKEGRILKERRILTNS